MGVEKVFKTHMTINWKTGTFKVFKRPKKSAGPFEIPIDIAIKVIIPEFKRIEVKGEIELSENKVKEMSAHAI